MPRIVAVIEFAPETIDSGTTHDEPKLYSAVYERFLDQASVQELDATGCVHLPRPNGTQISVVSNY